MDKQGILRAIVARLESDLDATSKAALDAAESAVDDEARSESKYDTRGLETSYLASAQAHHAKDIRESLAACNALLANMPQASSKVSMCSLVTTLSSEGKELFFIAPAAGGASIDNAGESILVLTPQSPLGAKMIGAKVSGQIAAGVTRTIIRVE